LAFFASMAFRFVAMKRIERAFVERGGDHNGGDANLENWVFAKDVLRSTVVHDEESDRREKYRERLLATDIDAIMKLR
jgi:hypothetical protein